MSRNKIVTNVDEYRGTFEYKRKKDGLLGNKNLPLIIEYVKQAKERNMLVAPATKDWIVAFSTILVRGMYLHQKPMRLMELSEILKRENVYQLYDNISSALFILTQLGLITAVHFKGWKLTVELMDILAENDL